MKRLIVNADDFGLTRLVNQGILDAYLHGIVTSTTLMANGQAFKAAAEILRDVPRLGVGIHLNLTHGFPVSPAHAIPTLVDSRGRLHLSPGQLWKGIIIKQVRIADVDTELRSQIAKVRSAGISPTHLDGHKHIHVLPGVSDVVIRLARDFDIRCVRCPLEEAPNLSVLFQDLPSIKQSVVSRAVSYFARRLRSKLWRAGILFTGHFYGLSQTGFLDASGIRYLLQDLPEGTSELMCHPGYLDIHLDRTGTRLLRQREIEVQALTAASVRALVMANHIQLINYGDLLSSTREVRAVA